MGHGIPCDREDRVDLATGENDTVGHRLILAVSIPTRANQKGPMCGRVQKTAKSRMNMREIMTLTEGKLLQEAAGTYGFYRPSDDTEILADGNHTVEHADYVIKDPERFGLTRADVERVEAEPDDAGDNGSPDMQRMSRILALLFAHGWVRVNYFRGGWSFHAIDLPTVTAALRHYASEDWIDEASLEWGPRPANPEWAHTLYPNTEVKRYLRTGKLEK